MMVARIERQHPMPPCPTCGNELLFAARVQTQMTLENGQSIPWSRKVTLCPSCQRDDPACQGVLAYFTMHERVTPDTAQEAGSVIREWVERSVASPAPYSDADLDEDIRRWEAGEM